jgi:hypothetical protein
MWDQSLDAITTDTVRTLQYDLDTSSMFTLDVVGEGQTEWAYNTLVTVTADALEGQTFNYWLRDGEIVSYDETIKVSMLQDVTLEPVYSSQTVSEEPVIYLSDSIELRTGYTSHIAQFYLPEGYELIDYGMLTVDAPYIGFELDTVYLNDTVVNNQGLSYHAPSNEFLMTFTSANAVSVRAYMVYEYLGTIGVVYSYIPEAKTLDITSPFFGSPIVDVRVNDGFGGFVQEFTVYFDGVLYDTVTDGKTELASESLNANTIGRYVFVINGVEYPVEEE